MYVIRISLLCFETIMLTDRLFKAKPFFPQRRRHPRLPLTSTRATHRHAGQTPTALSSTATTTMTLPWLSASVGRASPRAIRTSDVGRSASPTTTARRERRVDRSRSALTPAQVFAGQMHSAKWSTTTRCASAKVATQDLRTRDAHRFHVSISL